MSRWSDQMLRLAVTQGQLQYDIDDGRRRPSDDDNAHLGIHNNHMRVSDAVRVCVSSHMCNKLTPRTLGVRSGRAKRMGDTN